MEDPSLLPDRRGKEQHSHTWLAPGRKAWAMETRLLPTGQPTASSATEGLGRTRHWLVCLASAGLSPQQAGLVQGKQVVTARPAVWGVTTSRCTAMGHAGLFCAGGKQREPRWKGSGTKEGHEGPESPAKRKWLRVWGHKREEGSGPEVQRNQGMGALCVPEAAKRNHAW